MEGFVTRKDTRYPSALSAVSPAIQKFWYKGKVELLTQSPKIAIVGSRRMTRYGRQVLAEMVPRLVEDGYVTVSGFMYGIDIEMHRLTIENGGMTIAVLGWGIDYKNAIEDNDLYNKVIDKHGLVISEYEPKSAPALWTFPQRNRIVVGLADKVVVVEAGLKSGSLNSAKWAIKLGKELIAVPGSLLSAQSEGCNRLIAKREAIPYERDMFGNNNYSENRRIYKQKITMTRDESKIFDLVRKVGPLSINSISRHGNLSVAQVASLVAQLELKGAIKAEYGEYISCL